MSLVHPWPAVRTGRNQVPYCAQLQARRGEVGGALLRGWCCNERTGLTSLGLSKSSRADQRKRSDSQAGPSSVGRALKLRVVLVRFLGHVLKNQIQGCTRRDQHSATLSDGRFGSSVPRLAAAVTFADADYTWGLAEPKAHFARSRVSIRR